MELNSFKTRATRVRQFLASKGHELPHTTVLEAMAKYEGFRSYKAMASTCEPELDVQLPKEGIAIYSKVHVTTDPDGGEPYACAIYLTQASLTKLVEGCAQSKALNMDLTGDIVALNFFGGDYRLIATNTVISREYLWVHAKEKFAGLLVESKSMRLDALLIAIRAALSTDKKCIFWDVPVGEAPDFIEKMLTASKNSPEGMSEDLEAARAQGHFSAYHCNM